MREIKFRGKDERGNWHYGYFVDGYMFDEFEGLTQVPFIVSEQMKSNVRVIAKTVGQYTGLKDRNGKEIYEGDIVLIYDKGNDLFTEEPFTVEWIGNDEGGYGIGYGLFPSTFDYEVIGNIYENPELLEGTQNEEK